MGSLIDELQRREAAARAGAEELPGGSRSWQSSWPRLKSGCRVW